MPALLGESEKERLIGLDLARALAILGVLLAHFLPHHWFSGIGGFLGVELFFALSGFLIGGLLMEIVERDPSPRSLLVFLIRRWVRTLPLYVLWLFVMLVIASPPDIRLYAVKYLIFMQNFAWPMPANNWFGVSWSLAVEEWFYLLFSVCLIAFAARRGKGTVLIVCMLFVAVPLIARTMSAWETTGTQDFARLSSIALTLSLMGSWSHGFFVTDMTG